MEKINILYSEEQLQSRISELADELYKVYGDEEVVFVSVLKGAIFFTVDLAKKFKGDARIDFLRVSSYEGENSTGTINLKIALKEENIKGKHVLIVEDIIDTGHTAKFLLDFIGHNFKTKSTKFCSLLDKKSKRIVDVEADFSGFIVEDKFLVGYGLDFEGYYRNIPYVGYVDV